MNLKTTPLLRRLLPALAAGPVMLLAFCTHPLLAAAETGDNGSRAYKAYESLALPTGQRQLFIDDFLLGDVDRVERVIHQPTRFAGNPVISADLPTDGRMITLRDAPSWDEQEQVWKLWYYRYGDDGNGAGGSGYARSKDGIHWEKPVLGLVDALGSKNNNIVMVKGEPNVFTQHILIDPLAPPDRRYKGMIGWSDRRPMVSANGVEFTALSVPPIPSHDESHLNWDGLQSQWILTHKLPGPFGRAVYLSTSKDFEQWSKPILIYHADFLDQELGAKHIERVQADPKYWRPPINNPREYKTEIYNMPVFAYEGLYLGLPTYFESSGRIPPPFGNQDGTNSVKLVASRDLRAWTRVGDRAHFIPIAEMGEGVLDTGQISAASHPILRGDELWFYYQAVDVRYRQGDVASRRDWYHGAIYLAKLRRDGFVSMRAGLETGLVETRAVNFEGGKLFINATISGQLKVEIFGPTGVAALDGWEKSKCTPVTGDQLKAEVVWPGKDLAELKGKPVRLRFWLEKADLYSFWFE